MGNERAIVASPCRKVCLSIRTVAGVSNGEINRELTALKRMFSLAIQAGKLLQKPHIPLLKADNVRVGFFEREQFLSVLERLPEPVRPAATFAYITGWRIDSEILSLEWRQGISAPAKSNSIQARRRTVMDGPSR